MSNYRLLHNPRCSKSREAYNYLIEKNISFETIDYMKSLLSVNELQGIAKKLNLSPSDFIRKKEDIYKELSLANKSDSELFQAMSENPKLIERPILITADSATIGRPLDNIISLL